MSASAALKRDSFSSQSDIDVDHQDFSVPLMPNQKSLHTLEKKHFWSYAVGHVLNDLSAACWFTYLLVYLQDVRGLSSSQAGAVLLAGQLADGLATPLVGILSDKSAHLHFKVGKWFEMGRRKIWHFGGTFMVAICFFMVFGMYSVSGALRNLSDAGQTIYYMIAASLFNIGWAAVQVSHMSLVPELSPVDTDRVGLNSARYAFTVTSNVLVFLLLLCAIRLFPSDQETQYFALSLATLCIGGIASFIFQFGTPEHPVNITKENLGDESTDDPLTWKDWLKCPKYQKVAFVYMCTRLVVNVSQVFIPFFVEYTLGMTENGSEAITIVPLIVYISSFCGTILMKRINRNLGRRKGYILGGFVCTLAFIAFFFMTRATSYLVYPAAALLGLGNATIMVCAVSLESDLVGFHIESGAFVYGSLSFTDKFSNGIVIFIIQKRDVVTADLYRLSISAIPAAAAVSGMICAYFTVLHPHISHSTKRTEAQSPKQIESSPKEA
jgi:Na+/melibiose symporter-like transporter